MSRKKEENPLQTLLKRCYTNECCTFVVTKKEYCEQRYYQCSKCDLKERRGCCISCMKVCHKGHPVTKKSGSSRFYCDCYLTDHCKLKGKTFPGHEILSDEVPEVEEDFTGSRSYSFKNGNYYEGEWKNGKMNGNGKMKIALGSYHYYEGQFVDNKMEGEGVFNLYSSALYKGNVRDNKPNGFGRLFGESGNVAHEGDFLDGSKNGHGVSYYTNGRKMYEGMYRDNQRNGVGVGYSKDGRKSHSCKTWKMGNPHGVVITELLRKKPSSKSDLPHQQHVRNDRKRRIIQVYYDGKLLGELKPNLNEHQQQIRKEEEEEEGEEEEEEEKEIHKKKKKKSGDDKWFSLKTAPKHLLNDKRFAISILEIEGAQLEFVDPPLREDSQVVLSACESDPSSLLLAHSIYRTEEALVKDILKRNGECLCFCDEKFQTDQSIISIALGQNGLVLDFLDTDYQKKNIDLLITAVRQNGNALKYVKVRPKDENISEEDYKKVISVAVESNPISIRYVQKEFVDQGLVNICLEILKTKKNNEVSSSFSEREILWSSFFESLIILRLTRKKWVTERILNRFTEKLVPINEVRELSQNIIKKLVSEDEILSNIKEDLWTISIFKKTCERIFSVHIFSPEVGSDHQFFDRFYENNNNNDNNSINKVIVSTSDDKEVYFGFMVTNILEKKRWRRRMKCGEGIQFLCTSKTSGASSAFQQLLTTKKKRQNRCRMIFTGHHSVRDGLKFGKGKQYSRRNGSLVFDGYFNHGVKNGIGMEYRKSFGKFNVVEFEGLFVNNERHGRGEYNDLKTGKVYRGVWEEGVLQKQSLFSFDCPSFNYLKICSLLKNFSIIGSGAVGIIYKVPVNQIPGLSSLRKKRKRLYSSPPTSSPSTPTTTSTPDSSFVAVKIMKCSAKFQVNLLHNMVKRGIGLCSTLQSPHILPIYGIIRGSMEVGYIMDLCKISVHRMIQVLHSSENSMKMKDKIRILYQVSLGMRKLHEKLVMHRDLKWANVMLDFNDEVKITDFDTLKEDERQWRIESIAQTSRIGTTGFLAPEVFLGKNYSLSCDVYAFGMVNFPFVSSYQCPSCGIKLDSIMRSNSLDFHVANCNLRPLLTKHDIDSGTFPNYLIEIMTQSWSRDPLKRPSFETIVEIFESEMNKYKQKQKCYSVLTFRFPDKKKYHRLKDQKMLLVRPKVSKIVEWIEKKFLGSKVVHLSYAGETLEGDDQILRIIQLQGDPIIDVELDQVVDDDDEERTFVFQKKKKKKDEMEILRKENEELKEKLGSEKRKNEILELENQKMLERMKEMEEKMKMLEND